MASVMAFLSLTLIFALHNEQTEASVMIKTLRPVVLASALTGKYGQELKMEDEAALYNTTVLFLMLLTVRSAAAFRSAHTFIIHIPLLSVYSFLVSGNVAPHPDPSDTPTWKLLLSKKPPSPVFLPLSVCKSLDASVTFCCFLRVC